MMLRVLEGQARDDWLEIIGKHEWEDNSRDNFICLLQNLGLKSFSPKAFKDQCKSMDKGKIKIPENNMRKGTKRLFQINKLIVYLGIYAQKYTIKEMNKIFVKSLPPKAMVKYVSKGGDNLEDKHDILELMMQINNNFKLKAEAAVLERKANLKDQHSNHPKEKGDIKQQQLQGRSQEPLQKA